MSVILLSQDDFSEDELRKFAEVYVAQKAPDFACGKVIHDWLIRSGMPEQCRG